MYGLSIAGQCAAAGGGVAVVSAEKSPPRVLSGLVEYFIKFDALVQGSGAWLAPGFY